MAALRLPHPHFERCKPGSGVWEEEEGGEREISLIEDLVYTVADSVTHCGCPTRASRGREEKKRCAHSGGWYTNLKEKKRCAQWWLVYIEGCAQWWLVYIEGCAQWWLVYIEGCAQWWLE